MKIFIQLILIITIVACKGQSQDSPVKQNNSTKRDTTNIIQKYYNENKGNDQPSKSLGNVFKGKLVNGKLLPYKGKNFQYFDTTSYIHGRAYLNDKVKKTIIESYKKLEEEIPNRKFFVMECSNKEGGKLFPHRTHQNGLSVDFMSPMLKDRSPYYGLDTIGSSHYFLDFNKEGKNEKDQSISIDFNTIARHLLILQEQAKLNGLKIEKVIFKIELKDELFASEYGKKINGENIYFAQSLTPLINSLHDDHYHVDFAISN